MNDPFFTKLEAEVIKKVEDPKIGLKGYLIIDSTINDRSIGGLRMTDSVSQEEIHYLARSMTLKQSFVGIPRGGAKAGIVASEMMSESEKGVLLKRFGQLISDDLKNRKYVSGSDMGTNTHLINKMYDGGNFKITKRSTGSPNSGYFTSLSVMLAIEECLKIKGLEIKKCTFAIEGFGSVGSTLALRLYKKGGRVIAVSNRDGAIYKKEGLNIPELIDLKTQNRKWILDYPNAQKISHAELLKLSVDVLCPCALDSTINRNNMKDIKAKIICAGANNPVTTEADHYLFEEGILYLPDFATNCGGVLGNAMEFMGLDENSIQNLIKETITPKYRKIYEISQRIQKTPREIGLKITEQNFARMKSDNKKKTIKSKIFNIALGYYRRGLIPKFLVKNYSYRYFKKLTTSDSCIYKNALKRQN